MACSRLLLAVVVVSTACSEGDNSDDTSTLSAGTVTGATVTGTPTTTDPSTGAATSTTADSSTGEPDPGTSTSTTAAPTTGEPDPDSSSGSDDTGPICDPGMPNCVCDAGTCVDGYVCQNDVCSAGLDCQGDVEPPADAEDSAQDLGDITDNDDDFIEQSGVLSGTSDVDWYTWHGADTALYIAEPTFTLVSGTQRHCLFLECDDGGVAQTGVDCPEGSDFAISPKLRPGCCSAASFQIKDLNCPGNDESVTMWLRVDKAAADMCSPYTFQAHF